MYSWFIVSCRYFIINLNIHLVIVVDFSGSGFLGLKYFFSVLISGCQNIVVLAEYEFSWELVF